MAVFPPGTRRGPPVPAGFVPGSDNYTNPYADEKPLFSIDINNYKEYADNLTAGTIGVMEKLGPDGFRLDIYPTHRDYVPTDWMIANAKKNATGATLSGDGLKIDGNLPGVPFPMPANGYGGDVESYDPPPTLPQI